MAIVKFEALQIPIPRLVIMLVIFSEKSPIYGGEEELST